MGKARRPWRPAALGAGLAAVAALVFLATVLLGTGSGDPGSPPSADVPARGAFVARIASRTGGPRIPSGYLGLSIEFQAVRAYTGTDPRQVNPVLVQLIRNLSPGQRPVLRIGGDSTDVSWVPGPGVKPPRYESYRLTPGWLATTAALARVLGARMIMGLNLAADEPALDGAEARAFRASLGQGLEAFEIGNEPNVYGKIALFKTRHGTFEKARRRSFGYVAFRSQFDAAAAAAPSLPLAGPALAVGPIADKGSWVQSMGAFLAHEQRVSTFTMHRYPLRNCYVPKRSKQYPTVAHLLSNYATTTLVAGLRRWIRIAHSHDRPLRLDELNSVACRGKPGISDTMASALWVTDALFSLADAGVNGVNMHTLPKSAYELFHFTHRDGRWQAYVQPVYYGLELFAQAAPPGARIVRVPHAAHSGLSIWATRAVDGTLRVVLVNKDPRRARAVSLRMPAGTNAPATVERLRAASVYARRGVTLGGRTYGSATETGVLGPPRDQSLTRRSGAFTLSVPPGSAALVTFG
jgi:Glycosyl hydrolase family 79 C-terminal beta domain